MNSGVLKRLFKYLSYCILSIVVLLCFYLGADFCLSRITVGEQKDSAVKNIEIYILTNGVHTDLVFPVKTDLIDWSKEISYSNTHIKDTSAIKYLALGWGDKGFYLQTPEWSDLKFSVAFKAVTGLGTSAIHATYYQSMQEGEDCKKIMISEIQYKKLIQFISASLQHDKNGKPIFIKTDANYNERDAFYEAKGSYSLFYTCNTWANDGLKRGGLKACLWTAFDTGIFLKY